eukprot:1759383-Rhodomonas_salina.1
MPFASQHRTSRAAHHMPHITCRTSRETPPALSQCRWPPGRYLSTAQGLCLRELSTALHIPLHHLSTIARCLYTFSERDRR